ncbi:MAG: CsgG/HfaB family protein [Elusimicrobiales bacterium]|nr:CsgG/HfaB family protein [Elusimicrobiales bacterium]
MTIKKMLFTALACALGSVPAASAASLDAQLGKISKQFAQDAAAKLPDQNPATAAVFPFQAEEALAKRKVDVAISELLMQKLMREPKFRIVERTQLDALLREQKLGLSGAIESETAARIGKLAGARLAAMGSVTRMGKNYQISAKLVDTETSDVVSVSIVEVPSSVFEEEAARYLVLVPETQTLSIYLVLGAAPMQVKNLPPATAAGKTVVPANIKVGSNIDNGLYAGIGLKYFPFSRWAVDLAFLPAYQIGDSRKSVITNFSGQESGMMPASAEGMIMRVLLNRQFRVSKGFNAYAGGGFMRFELDPRSDEKSYFSDTALPGGGSIRMAPDFGAGRYSTPLASLGFEWKPQSRFGLSVLATFPLSSDKYKWEADITNGTTERITVWEMSYPKYLAEMNLAWYF